MDINVHVNLTAPEITNALLSLISATIAPAGREGVPPSVAIPAPVQIAPQPVSAATLPPPLQYAPPVATVVTPVPVIPAPVPIATPQAYTLEALANAAAPLVQAGKQPELVALLGQFGVQAMGQLKPEQYGVFATALRQMGGKI